MRQTMMAASMLMLLASHTLAAPPVAIGSIEFQLGSSKTSVLQRLQGQEKLKLVSLSNSQDIDTRTILERQPDDTWDTVGSIEFRSDKLYRATRIWAAYQTKESFWIGDKLAALLKRQGAENRPVKAEVLVQPLSAPGVSGNSITLFFPDRQVTISSMDTETSGKVLQIDEVAEKDIALAKRK
jgi:hypothetical protein